jgi:hypothetical protein
MNVCETGSRTEDMTLPRAVALLGPALSGIMSRTNRAVRSRLTPRETPLSRASSVFFIAWPQPLVRRLKSPLARPGSNVTHMARSVNNIRTQRKNFVRDKKTDQSTRQGLDHFGTFAGALADGASNEKPACSAGHWRKSAPCTNLYLS